MADFRWTNEKEQAALDLALSELTDAKIAEKAGVARETIWAWKQSPEFQARIDEHLSVIRERVRAQGIAVLELRVRRLNDHWRRMQQVVEERAADPEMAKAPGGTSGLLVRKFKMIGSGDAATMVVEYEFDSALMRELREHEKQAAQELGQWTEKLDQSGQTTVTVRYVNNWRENAGSRDSLALPASGPVPRPGHRDTFQLAGGGETLAEDDAGDGDRGGRGGVGQDDPLGRTDL